MVALWSRRPTSLIAWGEDRRLLDELAVWLARSNSPIVYWVDIEEEAAVDRQVERRFGGADPGSRFFSVRPSDLALADADRQLERFAAPLTVRGADLQADEVRDFLGLPKAIQSVIEGAQRPYERGTVVLAHADRASRMFPAAGTFSPFVRLLNRRSLTFIVTSVGRPGTDAPEFDYVLEIEPASDGPAVCVCRKGRARGRFAPFVAGARTPLDSLLQLLAAPSPS